MHSLQWCGTRGIGCSSHLKVAPIAQSAVVWNPEGRTILLHHRGALIEQHGCSQLLTGCTPCLPHAQVVPRHAGGWRCGDQCHDVAERRQERSGSVELHAQPGQQSTGEPCVGVLKYRRRCDRVSRVLNYGLPAILVVPHLVLLFSCPPPPRTHPTCMPGPHRRIHQALAARAGRPAGIPHPRALGGAGSAAGESGRGAGPDLPPQVRPHRVRFKLGLTGFDQV